MPTSIKPRAEILKLNKINGCNDISFGDHSILEGDGIPPLKSHGQELEEELCFPGVLSDNRDAQANLLRHFYGCLWKWEKSTGMEPYPFFVSISSPFSSFVFPIFPFLPIFPSSLCQFPVPGVPSPETCGCAVSPSAGPGGVQSTKRLLHFELKMTILATDSDIMSCMYCDLWSVLMLRNIPGLENNLVFFRKSS